MNKIKILALVATTLFATSCKDFLDINENPNQALDSTPQNVLAAALTVTAANTSGGVWSGTAFQDDFNSYGSWVAGYWSKSGEVNGYAPERTYTYTTSFYSTLWNNVYDNLVDFNYVQAKGTELGLPNHAAIAMIMKAYNFQALTDQYGSIPYTDALKGANLITPTYTKAEDIYKDLIVQLDAAIKMINDAPETATLPTAEDIVFKGDMHKWLQFANTLKLRILLRQSEVGSLSGYLTTEFGKLSTDFIVADVLDNPGYTQSEAKQNPFWERYNKIAAGTASRESGYVKPTAYAISKYNNDARIAKLYTTPSGGGTYTGTILGEENPLALNKLSNFGTGLFKSFDQGTPLMLAAESYFLQAEAKSRGFLPGGDAVAKTDYEKGITASFTFLGLTAANAQTYLTDNAANNLVGWAASTNKKETIIYQKWLALNSVNGNEAWSEYRRTGYPSDLKNSASLQSTSTRADKLPVRLLYPLSEIATNSANVPAANQFADRIFWDIN